MEVFACFRRHGIFFFFLFDGTPLAILINRVIVWWPTANRVYIVLARHFTFNEQFLHTNFCLFIFLLLLHSISIRSLDLRVRNVVEFNFQRIFAHIFF